MYKRGDEKTSIGYTSSKYGQLFHERSTTA